MKRLFFALIVLLAICICGCVDDKALEPEVANISDLTPTSPVPIPTTVITPSPTPEPIKTSTPTIPTPTPKTTETIYYSFFHLFNPEDVVTVEITVPIEDVEKTEEFFIFLDDAQNHMLDADDNSSEACWLNKNARITADGLEPGKELMYWIDVIKAEETAISFTEKAIHDYEKAIHDYEKAKVIAPTDDYEKICDLYIFLSEKGISCGKYYAAICKNMKYAYEQYKDNKPSQGDTVIERINDDVKKYNHESYKYDELAEELFEEIEKLL